MAIRFSFRKSRGSSLEPMALRSVRILHHHNIAKRKAHKCVIFSAITEGSGRSSKLFRAKSAGF